MKYIESTSDDIYFNLALEEYLFNNLKDDTYFMLWKNHNSIVLGKHQNVFEEINIKAIEKNNIKVARRNTGGGTVFHDRGNLNYSFITTYDKSKFIDYDQFITPIISALNSIGVNAEKKGSSDIVIAGKKISGNAQTRKNNRALHHGTLLFDADLHTLNYLLKTTEGIIESKSVKSRPSVVTNIKEHLTNKSLSINEFQELLLHTMFTEGIEKYEITKEHIEAVRKLVDNKYSKWEWNYGNSPTFSYKKESTIFDNPINIELSVKKGIINDCKISCEKLPYRDLEDTVTGAIYSYGNIKNKLQESNSLKGFGNINYEELADCFF